MKKFSRRRGDQAIDVQVNKPETTKPNAPRRQALSRDEPVVCAYCGRKAQRQLRGQRFCSPTCRERGRERTRKAFLGTDTGAPATPRKNTRKSKELQSTNDRSEGWRPAAARRAFQVEIIDPHPWEERISSDGVETRVAQLRPRYWYGRSS